MFVVPDQALFHKMPITTDWTIVINIDALQELDLGTKSLFSQERVAKRDLPYRLPLRVDACGPV